MAYAIRFGELGRYSYSSVCARCGAERGTNEWQIPATSLSLYDRSSFHETHLSRVLVSRGLMQPHEHDWLFCQGSGNGVLCAIGKGRHILSSTHSVQVADLIEYAHRFGEHEFRDRLIKELFNIDTTSVVRTWAGNLPRDRFREAVDFRKWLDRWSGELDEMLREAKDRG